MDQGVGLAELVEDAAICPPYFAECTANMAVGHEHQTKTLRTKLLALGGRTQRRARRPHAGDPLATGRAAGELLRASATHPAVSIKRLEKAWGS